MLLTQAGLEREASACSWVNSLTQPGLGPTVLNHWYRIRARWGQEAEKEKNLTLKKEELLLSKYTVPRPKDSE